MSMLTVAILKLKETEVEAIQVRHWPGADLPLMCQQG